MTRQNGSIQGLRRVLAIAGLVFLAAGALPAISVRERPGKRRDAMREALTRTMDIFAANYGDTDWSRVTDALAENPSDPANPAFMSVPLSLANVYLNRYERSGDKASFDRSVGIVEWVVWNRALWERREGSGSVVGYLDITARRLQAECDVGGYEFRIDEIWRAAMGITADEADAITSGGRCRSGTMLLEACPLAIQPFPAEEESRASRAALLAAASSFLADDARASVWARGAKEIAQLFPQSDCRSAETEIVLTQAALSYRLANAEVPEEFDSGRAAESGTPRLSCSGPFATSYETASPVAAVDAGPALDAAIRDSRVVAFHLSESYLWLYPPGSQCERAGEAESLLPEQRAE
jgi:hypothetical protein